MKSQKGSIKKVALNTAKSLWNLSPILVGTILLISLAINIIPKNFYSVLFENNILLGSFIASLIGSISAGTPVTSYIIGGELLEKGTSIIIITAFIVSWVTVGIIQFPIEAKTLGKKFAILRNLISFISSIIVALITAFILGVI